MFNCTISLNEERIGIMFTFFELFDKVYLFSGMSLNNKEGEMLKYSPLYEEIIWSFSFIEE